MTYYETPGVLSDICQYISCYYNENRFISIINLKFTETHSYLMQFYYQMKSDIGSLPEHLLPFAYSDEKIYSLLNNIIYFKLIDNYSFDCFIEYLNSIDFKSRMYNHWTSSNNITIKDIENLDLLEFTSALCLPDAMKYTLLNFFGNFEQCVADLILLIKKLYIYVIQFRQNYKDLLETSKEYFTSTLFINRISATHKLDTADYSYTITLINCLHYSWNSSKKIIFLGARCYRNFEKKVSLQSFSWIYQNPDKVSIVELILKSGFLCKKEVEECLGLKSQTVQKYLDELFSEGIIYINKQHYLMINEDYFKNLPVIYNQALSKLTGAKKDEA